ncbi:MAG: ankyrin repeat domain-containing protein [Bdellovibrionales bacterium]
MKYFTKNILSILFLAVVALQVSCAGDKSTKRRKGSPKVENQSKWFQAVLNGNSFLLNTLSKKVNVNAQRASDGKTALHLAFEKEDTDMARDLLSYGASSSKTIQDDEGNTPLHIAAMKNNVTLARLGDGYGPIKQRNKEGLTPERLAKNLKNYQVANYLSDSGFGQNK